jgi:Mg2+/Co2+ transporter CorB
MLDFFIGIIAIAAIFAIRRFLFVEDMSNSKDSLNIFCAATSVKNLNGLLQLEIPEDLGNTIAGVLNNISINTGKPLIVGSEFDLPNAKARIIKMKDGLIEQVLVRVHER